MDADRLERWRSIPSSVASDLRDRTGAMVAIRRLSGERLVAPAFPVGTVTGDNRTLHLCIEQAPAGTALVIDAEGFEGRAVWGEVLTHAAIAAGLAGVVIDGAVRDLDSIQALGFPVFARGVNPAGPHKGWVGRIGLPISCGGVPVAAGDLIVGDGDGVTVVPADREADLLVACEQRLSDEAAWIARIRAGESSATILGLGTEA